MSHPQNYILHRIISLHIEVAELQNLWQSEDKVKAGKAINSSVQMWRTCGKHMHKTVQEDAW